MSRSSTPGAGVQRERERLGRALDAVLPPPPADRLVPVAETTRPMLSMVESSLADVGITPSILQIATMNGSPRFRILVSAGDADVARQAVSGL